MMPRTASQMALLAKALVAAATAAASPSFLLLPFALADPVAALLPMAAFLSALVLGGLIGLPAYLLFRALGFANYLTAVLCGVFTGALFPVAACLAGLLWGGACADGQGWLPYFAALGGVAGAVFHLVASAPMDNRRR